MSDIVTAVLAIVVVLFFGSLLGTLIGAVTGLVVGMFWTPTILSTLSRFGADTTGMEVWQLGATMGFLGGFLSTSVRVTGK